MQNSSFDGRLVASRRLERLRRERNGRLAHAKGSDDGGHQAKYGERVEPAANLTWPVRAF